MTQLTVTAKGQVTLKRELLQHLGVQPGDRIVADVMPDGRVELRAAPLGNVQELFGLLERPDGPRLTIEEIKEVTQRGWAGER